ncbi:hypothetical protein, partial [Effusibacillus consociatus]
ARGFSASHQADQAQTQKAQKERQKNEKQEPNPTQDFTATCFKLETSFCLERGSFSFLFIPQVWRQFFPIIDTARLFGFQA